MKPAAVFFTRTRSLRAVVLLGALCAMGCPDRKEVIDAVGGAPKAQVEQARTRIQHLEKQSDKRAADAALTTE